jgi:hypothetical protein
VKNAEVNCWRLYFKKVLENCFGGYRRMRKFVGEVKRRMSWESFTAALLIVILHACASREKNTKPHQCKEKPSKSRILISYYTVHEI